MTVCVTGKDSASLCSCPLEAPRLIAAQAVRPKVPVKILGTNQGLSCGTAWKSCELRSGSKRVQLTQTWGRWPAFPEGVWDSRPESGFPFLLCCYLTYNPPRNLGETQAHLESP